MMGTDRKSMIITVVYDRATFGFRDFRHSRASRSRDRVLK